MRARKLKDIEGRFTAYASAIESCPDTCAGAWAKRHLPDATAVCLDLGCGKGSFAVQGALRHPDVLYIGIDNAQACIALAAQKAVEACARNAIFVYADARDVTSFFAPGEIDELYLNFSSPFPPAKYARKRLTHVERLVTYRDLLSADALVEFRTDSVPLFEFSLVQFALAGYELVFESRDYQNDWDACSNGGAVQTEYERELVEAGAHICVCRARKSTLPKDRTQTAELSLAAYLPDDLDSLDYIPRGMETTVINWKNRRAKLAARSRANAKTG